MLRLERIEIPVGFCQCGCGQRTSFARTTAPKREMVRGEPLRFMVGHNNRRPTVNILLDHTPQGSDDECWEWQGPRWPLGYGRITQHNAHRVMYEHVIGPIAAGLCVMHSCDNPPCVNPAHLSLGTHAENMADMARKGRARPNGRVSRAKGR